MDGIPLMEIFGTYNAWKVDEKTWFINFMGGSQNMYLLEGDEKALLIDTGFGAGNLLGFVEKLTDKPLLVVNTHFHPDHIAGNGEFPKVYMSKNAMLDEPSVGFAISIGIIPFDIENVPYPNYEKVFIEEGFVFDLGNRKVEVLDTKPSHCNSSLLFLDRKHRMLFCGDEAESAQVNLFDNSYNPEIEYIVKDRLLNFKDTMLKMKSLDSEYDMLLPNHNGFPISKTYLDSFVGLVDGIFDGTALIEDKLNHKYLEMDPKASKLCRVRWKDASIFIEKDEVMKVYGKGI